MRYQVVTYSNDVGSDEKMWYNRKSDAIKEAMKYRKGIRYGDGTLIKEEYAAVYDTATKTAYVLFGNEFSPVFADYVKVVKL